MHTKSTNPDAPKIIMKAFIIACEQVNINIDEQCLILAVSRSEYELHKKIGFGEESKTMDIQLLVLRALRAINRIGGGDLDFVRHWLNSKNFALHGIPAKLILTYDGLLHINEYLDIMSPEKPSLKK